MEQEQDDGEEESGGKEAEAIAFGGDVKWAALVEEEEHGLRILREEAELGILSDGVEGVEGALSGDGAEGPIEERHGDGEAGEDGESDNTGDDEATLFLAEEVEEEGGEEKAESGEDEEVGGGEDGSGEAGVGGEEEIEAAIGKAEDGAEGEVALDGEEGTGEEEDEEAVEKLVLIGGAVGQPCEDREEGEGGAGVDGGGEPAVEREAAGGRWF